MEQSFIGLSKKSAQDLADRMNFIFRLVSVNGEPYLGKPEDCRNDRICIDITDGKVSAAVIQ